VARAGNYPRLEATANYIYANPNPRFFPSESEWNGTWDVGVVLSWTPTGIPGNAASAAVSEARMAETAAQRGALEDSLRIEVHDAIEGVKEARFALGVTESGLRAAEESYRVRRELFRAGRSTLVELTDAEAELTRARIDAVDARVNSRIALVALNYALGRDTLAQPAK
jgi:outer membrane protein TolC